MNTFKHIAWVLGILVACALPAVAADDVTEVQASGEATIKGGDLASAKKSALLDAKRNAVDQVGSEIVSKTVVEDFELVKDQIISKASGFVHSYKITNEDGCKSKSGSCVLEITAKVSASQMADEAKLIYEDLDKPRIMVIVPQIAGGDMSASRSIETGILAFLREKGFEVVDANTVQANIRKDEQRLLADGDTNAAAKIALRSGADVVVMGDSTVGTPSSIMGELWSASGTMNLRAIQASNAKIIAAESINHKVIQATQDLAIQQVASQAAQKAQKGLFTKIIKAWSNAALNGQRVEIKLSNVSKFSQLKKIKMLLGNQEGVTEVQQRTFSKPVAIFDVTFRGSADRMAELLDGASASGVSIEIMGLSAGVVEGRVK